MFSFAGIGKHPILEVRGDVDAFGSQSMFAEIVRQDSTLVFYGAGLISATILHHAESASGGPLYRYEKSFPGIVTTLAGEEISATLKSHVRPLNQTLTYDAAKMAKGLLDARLLIELPEAQGRICAIGAKQLVEFWKIRILEDPFYLLDDASRQWVEPQYHSLGRRFLISDFEGPA
jgi:aminoglycoside N3'-acetyltransferase